jgi:hypothetical protein
MLDEVVKVFEEVPFLSPDILSDVESLHYVYSVAEWEMGLAEALLHRGDDEKQAAGGNNSQHGFVSFDMYWRTLIGNMTEEEDGPVTADTYTEFRQAENASQSSQLDCCNGLGLAQTYSSTSWDSSCTVVYICSSAHLRQSIQRSSSPLSSSSCTVAIVSVGHGPLPSHIR